MKRLWSSGGWGWHWPIGIFGGVLNMFLKEKEETLGGGRMLPPPPLSFCHGEGNSSVVERPLFVDWDHWTQIAVCRSILYDWSNKHPDVYNILSVRQYTFLKIPFCQSQIVSFEMAAEKVSFYKSSWHHKLKIKRFGCVIRYNSSFFFL